MREARIAIAWLALVALAAACGGEQASPATPTSAFGPTGPTGPSEPTGASGPSVGAPTATGAILTPVGALTVGEVTFQLSGDLEVERTIGRLVSGVYAAPPGGMALVWTAGGTDATTVGIGGASFTGTRPTAPTLALTLTVQTPDGIASFLSNDGGCTIRIDTASEVEVAGRFSCLDLEDPTGLVVDVAASFRAAG